MPGLIAAFLPPWAGIGQKKARQDGLLKEPAVPAGCQLLEQGQHRLGLLVGLGQHGSSRLLDDLVLGQLARSRSVVRVHDGAA